MIIIKHIFFGAVCIFLGFSVLRYTARIILSVGMSEMADRYIPGGTLVMWKLIGIALVVVGLLVLFGYFRAIGV